MTSDDRTLLLRRRALLFQQRRRTGALLHSMDEILAGRFQADMLRDFDEESFRQAHPRTGERRDERPWDGGDFTPPSGPENRGGAPFPPAHGFHGPAQDILPAFEMAMESGVHSMQAHRAVELLRSVLRSCFGDAGDGMLVHFGALYLEEETQKAVDQRREGLARFIHEAIELYSGRQNQ